MGLYVSPVPSGILMSNLYFAYLGATVGPEYALIFLAMPELRG